MIESVGVALLTTSVTVAVEVRAPCVPVAVTV
jgi:hypothetical protein